MITGRRLRLMAMVFLWIMLPVLALSTAYHWFGHTTERTTRRHSSAVVEMMHLSAASACARIEDFETAATKLGWSHDRRVPVEGESPVLEVWVEPRAPFAKLPYRTLRFDAQGCVKQSAFDALY